MLPQYCIASYHFTLDRYNLVELIRATITKSISCSQTNSGALILLLMK